MRQNPTSEASETYEFKMAIFEIGVPENLLLFIKTLKFPMVGLELQIISE